MANSPFAADVSSPGMSEIGQSPSMSAFDMFNGGAMPEDVIIHAYEVRRKLMDQKELNTDRIRTIERMIRDMSNNHDPSMLKSYEFNLRRLDKLARICTKKNFDRDAFDATVALIEKREGMVKKLLEHCFKLRIGQKLLSDLTDDSAKQPLTKEVKAQYESEYKQICDEQLAAVKRIQKDLEPVEKVLLKDDRTWDEKYGIVAQTGGIITISFITFGLIGNLIQSTIKPQDSNS